MANFYITIIKIVVSYCLTGGHELNDYLNTAVCPWIIKQFKIIKFSASY